MKTDVGQDDSVSLSPEITIITTVLSSMSRTTSSARISVKADSSALVQRMAALEKKHAQEKR